MNMQSLFKMLQRAQMYLVKGLRQTAEMLIAYLKRQLATVQLAAWMRFLGFSFEDALSLTR